MGKHGQFRSVFHLHAPRGRDALAPSDWRPHRIFQPLENFFPIIGKTGPFFSNHWKLFFPTIGKLSARPLQPFAGWSVCGAKKGSMRNAGEGLGNRLLQAEKASVALVLTPLRLL